MRALICNKTNGSHIGPNKNMFPYTAPPRQKGLTDNFLQMELSPASCLECWYLLI